MNAVGEKTDNKETEKVETIDFKMVTFSLAGKDYSIDIMKVREISKARRFTYVPNSLPYVRGVYNLRGDIISIIDLRKMFNLPSEKADTEESDEIIILRLDDYLLGVIVDSIDKVVGISASTIQPPHPIFGDINIKFIQGVVEKDGRLYIILDVERIFGQQAEDSEPDKLEYRVSEAFREKEPEELNMGFITETLKTFKNFYVTDINNLWVDKRFRDWKNIRGNTSEDIQLKNETDAEDFLAKFYSTDTGRLWNQDFSRLVGSVLPSEVGNTIRVWNPGCGKGYESYSMAVLLSGKYRDASIKVWGNDKDLMSISNAPNLLFDKQGIPEYMDQYVAASGGGYQFNQDIKDIIMFEYHDITHPNTFPEVDIILARDVLSFLSASDQLRVLADFKDKLKPDGIVIIGDNEEIVSNDWKIVKDNGLTVYRKAE